MNIMKKATRDPENTRDKILDAALGIFSAKGYHDTRMDEIVDESGTSKGSIYFHFPNKERLFLALVDQFSNLLERRVTEAIEVEAKGIVRVRAALEAIVETFGRYRRPAAARHFARSRRAAGTRHEHRRRRESARRRAALRRVCDPG